MGGVPVLLALAVVGVDYGYQPGADGRIDYIVQVSPEHWEQARDAGEITSVIDPSVRGRVNRIIIRIGDEELPRDPGAEAATADDEAGSSVATAQALSPMPPPSDPAANIRIAMADDDYVPTPDLFVDSGQTAEALGARVMRPGPQSPQEEGNGFQIPAERTGDNEADGASRGGEQRPNQAEPTVAGSANSDRRNDQNAGNQASGRSRDPLSRLGGGANTGNGSPNDANSRAAGRSEEWVQPPSTDPRSERNARNPETARSGTESRHSEEGRDESDWAEHPSGDRTTRTPYPRNEANPSGGSPTTAANNAPRTTAPSRGFGAQPMSPVPNSNPGQAPPNRGYGETPASLQENRVAPYDPYRIAGYDNYNRPLNAAGELIPAANQSVDRQTPNQPPVGRGYNRPAYLEDHSDRYAMAGAAAERERREADAARRHSEPSTVPQYGQDRERPPATATEPSSPSDGPSASRKAEQEIAAELAAARAALRDSSDGAAENQSIASQPVFNFLLLVSLVANAYLILTMSKLLQRYRNVVANMRSASTSAG